MDLSTYGIFTGLSFSKLARIFHDQGWSVRLNLSGVDPTLDYSGAASTLGQIYSRQGDVIEPADDQSFWEVPSSQFPVMFIYGGNVVLLGVIGDVVDYCHTWFASGVGDTGFRVGYKLVQTVVGALTGGLSSALETVYKQISLPDSKAGGPVQAIYQPLPVSVVENLSPDNATHGPDTATAPDNHAIPVLTTTDTISQPETSGKGFLIGLAVLSFLVFGS